MEPVIAKTKPEKNDLAYETKINVMGMPEGHCVASFAFTDEFIESLSDEQLNMLLDSLSSF